MPRKASLVSGEPRPRVLSQRVCGSESGALGPALCAGGTGLRGARRAAGGSWGDGRRGPWWPTHPGAYLEYCSGARCPRGSSCSRGWNGCSRPAGGTRPGSLCGVGPAQEVELSRRAEAGQYQGRAGTKALLAPLAHRHGGPAPSPGRGRRHPADSCRLPERTATDPWNGGAYLGSLPSDSGRDSRRPRPSSC